MGNSSENGLNKDSTGHQRKSSRSVRVLNRIHRILPEFSHYLVTTIAISS